MGGQVTGVDAVEKNIGVASVHAVHVLSFSLACLSFLLPLFNGAGLV